MQLPRLSPFVHQRIVPVGVDQAALHSSLVAGLCRTIVAAGNTVGRSDFAGGASALLGSVPRNPILAGLQRGMASLGVNSAAR